jgi:hypothetical protein
MNERKGVKQELIRCQDARIESFGINREFRRLKIAINKKEYDELISRIEKANIFLQRLTQQSRLLEPIRRSRRKGGRLQKHGVERARKQARSLHNVLIRGDRWVQNCCPEHVVNLRLDRGWEEVEGSAKGCTTKLRLRIYLDAKGNVPTIRPHLIASGERQCLHGRWREIEVRSINLPKSQESMLPAPQGLSLLPGQRIDVKAPKKVSFRVSSMLQIAPAAPQITTIVNSCSHHLSAPSSTFSGVPIPSSVEDDQTEITDICKALSNIEGTCSDLHNYRGYLADVERGDRHELVSLQAADQSEHNIDTLENLLELNAQEQRPGRARISRRDRLAMAVVLASSVLHLDGSWLKAHWRSRDVLFLNVPQNPLFIPLSDYHPFLSWRVSPTDVNEGLAISDQTAALMEIHRIKSAPFFALGLTLIELSFGQRFVDLKETEDDDANTIISDRKTASRLLPYVLKESGLRYWDVVQRCLDCPFNVRVASLDDPEFRDAVCDHILTPLMEDLKEFDGSTG